MAILHKHKDALDVIKRTKELDIKPDGMGFILIHVDDFKFLEQYIKQQTKRDKQPEEIKGTPITFGDIYTSERFKELVLNGVISDYDGIAYTSDGKLEYESISCDLDDLKQAAKRYSHIVWYNR